MLHPNKTWNNVFYAICLIIIGPIGWAILAFCAVMYFIHMDDKESK